MTSKNIREYLNLMESTSVSNSLSEQMINGELGTAEITQRLERIMSRLTKNGISREDIKLAVSDYLNFIDAHLDDMFDGE